MWKIKHLTKELSNAAKRNNPFEGNIVPLGKKHISFISGIISDDTGI